MTTLPNVGLIGKLRSGKSAAGDYLASKYGYIPFAFADEMKADFHRRYPEVPRDPKPRACYQFHGELMRKVIGEDVWVRYCLAEVQRAYYASLDSRAVIADVRMPHEYEALAARSYVLIRVECPDAIRIARAQAAGDTFTHADLAHPTETALDGYLADFTVVNDKGLAELYAQIDEIMAELTLKEAL